MGGGEESRSRGEEWRPPETEQECLDYYQERISSSQQRQLLPLQEDLADWINRTLGLNHVTATNFIDVLDNGVILCHLAQVIQEKADEAVKSGLINFKVPVIKGPFFERASRRSFFSRDNMEKFIKFCKQLGVHQNLLFETNDLVQQNQPRNVILCLMEVARIATRFNLDPPGLVAFEKEIAEEESRDLHDWHFQPIDSSPRFSHSESTLCNEMNKPEDRIVFIQEGGCGVGEGLRRAASDRIQTHPIKDDPFPCDTTDDWSRSSIDDQSEIDYNEPGLDDLDVKVKYATKAAQRQCTCTGHKCDKLKVKKVGEGRYNIFGRNVFVRLLKGRHMMVRVGGGWDTLEHFLTRHDPCQAGNRSSRPSTPAAAGGGARSTRPNTPATATPSKSPRPYSALHSYDVHNLGLTPHSLAR